MLNTIIFIDYRETNSDNCKEAVDHGKGL